MRWIFCKRRLHHSLGSNTITVLRTFFLALVLSTMILCPLYALDNSPVTTEAAANALFARARQDLAALSLTIPRDILLNFRTRDELMVENNANGGLTMELDGFYRPYNPETIWIVSGLPALHTLSVMAHELTHAWQSTNSPMQDRKLKEGFAVWVQYHVLISENGAQEAERLTTWKDEDYGGGLRALLEIEKREGMAAVIETARKATKI